MTNQLVTSLSSSVYMKRTFVYNLQCYRFLRQNITYDLILFKYYNKHIFNILKWVEREMGKYGF